MKMWHLYLVVAVGLGLVILFLASPSTRQSSKQLVKKSQTSRAEAVRPSISRASESSEIKPPRPAPPEKLGGKDLETFFLNWIVKPAVQCLGRSSKALYEALGKPDRITESGDWHWDFKQRCSQYPFSVALVTAFVDKSTKVVTYVSFDFARGCGGRLTEAGLIASSEAWVYLFKNQTTSAMGYYDPSPQTGWRTKKPECYPAAILAELTDGRIAWFEFASDLATFTTEEKVDLERNRLVMAEKPNRKFSWPSGGLVGVTVVLKDRYPEVSQDGGWLRQKNWERFPWPIKAELDGLW